MTVPHPEFPTVDAVVEGLIADYRAEPRTSHLDSPFLPNRDRTIEIVEGLRRVMFPGFFDEIRLTRENINSHLRKLLVDTHQKLYLQVRESIRYQRNVMQEGSGSECADCDQKAAQIASAFMGRLPNVRRMLNLDVEAVFEGDPAATGLDEAIFCYPGIDAIFIHRIAHELHVLEVPLLPRIMSEYAHNETGIDIHPGAVIGRSFCIDHGTGVVVGETTRIGSRVKIYQGVTLGALSTKGGQAWRGRRRHPTIEDDVTIYGGAIILGGETVIGKGATIGGSVFITSSVPAGHTVTMNLPDLTSRPPKDSRRAGKP
ncbi:MAG: hypothetical protein JJU36_10525 [Phycisphaeraceae bacterium]|nr:hypothetical protein [Phycisphaeraceae bacterium]